MSFWGYFWKCKNIIVNISILLRLILFKFWGVWLVTWEKQKEFPGNKSSQKRRKPKKDEAEFVGGYIAHNTEVER